MMDEELRRQVRNLILQAALRWELIAASGDGGAYQLDGRDEEGHSWQDPAQLYQQYGVRGRVGARAEALTAMLLGSAAQRVILGSRSRGDEPPELADWEVDLYSRFKQRLHMRADGGLFITTDKGHAVELRADGSIEVRADDGRIFLTSQGGAEVELDDADTTTTITHMTGGGGAPTVLPEATGLGTNGQALVAGGTDNAFQLTLTADPMTAPGGGDVATVTFSKPFKNAPFAVPGMVSGNGDAQPYISSIAADKLTVAFQKAPLTPAGIYNVTVLVTG